MKARNQPTVTISDIAKQRELVQQNLRALEQQEQVVREQELARIKAAFDTFPRTLAEITGQEINLVGALKMGLRYVRGKLSFNTTAATNGLGSIRRYRNPLSEDERAKLKTALQVRQAIIDAGGTPDRTISQISQEFKTTDATVNKYKAQWGLTRSTQAV